MSLSPRPLRQTSTRWPGPSSRARRSATARAWLELQGGDDPLHPAEAVEGAQRLDVGAGDIAGALGVAQRGVLGTDPGVVETGGDRVGLDHLPVGILEEVAVGTVEDARPARLERRRVLPRLDAAAGGLDAEQLHVLVIEEGGEDADGVAPPAHAGDHRVGQRPPPLERLAARLVTDHPLKALDQGRIRVRAHHRPDHVMSVMDIGDPISDGLVGGVLQGPGTAVNRPDLGAEQAHAVDVDRLAPGVLATHVDDALEAEAGADGGDRHPVLAGPGLGDDPGLAHPPGQQHLAERVVELVGAGVDEVLALEPDLGTGAVGGQPPGPGQRGGTPGVVAQPRVQLGDEGGVGQRLVHRRLQLLHGGDQGLGHVGPAVDPEAPGGSHRTAPPAGVPALGPAAVTARS